MEPSQMWKQEDWWFDSRASEEITEMNEMLINHIDFIISQCQALFAHESEHKLPLLIACREALQTVQDTPLEYQHEDEYYFHVLAARILFHQTFALMARSGQYKTKWDHEKILICLRSGSWRLLLTDETMKQNLSSWGVCLLLHRSFGDEMGIPLPFYMKLLKRAQRTRQPEIEQGVFSFLITYFALQTSLVEIETVDARSRRSVAYWAFPSWISYLTAHTKQNRKISNEHENVVRILSYGKKYFGIDPEKVIEIIDSWFRTQPVNALAHKDLSTKFLECYISLHSTHMHSAFINDQSSKQGRITHEPSVPVQHAMGRNSRLPVAPVSSFQVYQDGYHFPQVLLDSYGMETTATDYSQNFS
jgi:hypothetical protein